MEQLRTRSATTLSLALAAIGLIYVGLIIWGMATLGPDGRIQGPVVALMEAATMLSALVLLGFALAVRACLAPEHAAFGTLGLALMAVLVGITCGVHFTVMTVGAPLIAREPSWRPLLSLDWPSVPMALDILAWDLVFGLAFASLGIGLLLSGRLRLPAGLMLASGVLSVAGLVALPLGNMNLRFIGIFGYTVLPVAACLAYAASLRKARGRNGAIPDGMTAG